MRWHYGDVFETHRPWYTSLVLLRNLLQPNAIQFPFLDFLHCTKHGNGTDYAWLQFSVFFILVSIVCETIPIRIDQ